MAGYPSNLIRGRQVYVGGLKNGALLKVTESHAQVESILGDSNTTRPLCGRGGAVWIVSRFADKSWLRNRLAMSNVVVLKCKRIYNQFKQMIPVPRLIISSTESRKRHYSPVLATSQKSRNDANPSI